MNILLVDDEPLVIQDIATSIDWNSLGIEHVFLAYSASQAMKEFEEHRIDMIICDVEMPKITGLQLLSWVHDTSPATRSIILTCHPLFDYAQEAIRLNCIDYMLKPVDTDKLQMVLKQVVDELQNTSPFQDQKAFWKSCVSGTYSDNSALWTMASKYSVASHGTSYLTVLIRPVTRAKTNGEGTDIMALLLDFLEQFFADTEAGHLFFLDQTRVIFGVFYASPEEIGPIADSVRYKLEKVRYLLPVAIMACMETSKGLVTTVHSFSKLRSFSDRTTSSCIRPAPDSEASEKQYFLSLSDPHLRIHEDDIQKEMKEQMTRLPADPSQRQEVLIVMRREIENWFFTSLVPLNAAPSELMQETDMDYLREQAITSADYFMNWLQTLLTIVGGEAKHNQPNSRAVANAQAYIDRNLELNLSRKDVANQVFLNPDYLNRCFKNELGVSISQYMLQKKVELAKHLLEHTSQNISSIAVAVGYNSLSSFSYMFKHETGETPMSYRRNASNL